MAFASGCLEQQTTLDFFWILGWPAGMASLSLQPGNLMAALVGQIFYRLPGTWPAMVICALHGLRAYQVRCRFPLRLAYSYSTGLLFVAGTVQPAIVPALCDEWLPF